MRKLFTLVFICILFLSSYAQNLGEPNTDFGTDGSFIFDPSVAHDMMEKILVQEDGKILTVGRARVGGDNYSIYASRHNVDGTLDETYGEGGIVYLKANPLIYMNAAFDAVLNKDGHLLIAGYTFDYINNSAFIICLDENGFENTDFGNNGYAISEYGNGIVYEAIDIDSKGRPIVTGYFDDQILVRRYNAKGKLDLTFGNDGTVIIILDPTLWAYCYAYDIEILDDDKMLITGHKVSADMLYESYLLRLNANGTLDDTFADKGVLYLNAGEYPEYATSISAQADGKYLVGGHADLLSKDPMLPRCESYITRVNADGTIDETFGTDGFVKFEPFEGDGCTNESYSVAAASDGQIFGTLYSYNRVTGASRAYVYNLDSSGQFKEDFAGSGIVALPRLSDDEVKINTTALAFKDNKNLLIGGHIALDYTSTQKLFLSCINIDIYGQEDESNENLIVTIDGTVGECRKTTSKNVPVFCANKWAISQQFYTAEEICKAHGTIESIAFKTSEVEEEIEKYPFTRNLMVYIVNSEEHAVAGNTMKAMSANDLVFSGDVEFSYNSWITIDIEDFEYTGKNILICVNDITGTNVSGGVTFDAFIGATMLGEDNGYRALYKRNTSEAFDATTTITGASTILDTPVPFVQFSFKEGSTEEYLEPAQPTNFIVTALNESEVLLEWDSDKNTSSYDIYNGTEIIANITETSYIVKDLSLGWHCFKIVGVNGIKKSTPSEIECVELVEIEEPEILKELSTSLLLYPNPVKDILHIVTETEVEDVVIYDAFGRLQVTETPSHQDEMIIDVSGLNKGIYFVMIKTNYDVVMKKFVKQ